ncbi:hypothetical protein ASD8599_03457 [Ascidiaceihabitans donghaensis]|uniref:Uncharacterized protein n=1 Tax=Ascidiaceihabitans donghaensis TaxID=1510460 RepID=A0A2R8BI03_9RHOB|nr:hypothetical protein ASD8599_03457 [Ascidiaceihabitans donghaensis]
MKDGRHTAFSERCLSIDIEVNPKAADVFARAAVWYDGRAPLVLPKGIQAVVFQFENGRYWRHEK